MGNNLEAAASKDHSGGKAGRLFELLVEELGCSESEALQYLERFGADEFKIVSQLAADVLPEKQRSRWGKLFKTEKYLEDTKTLIRNYRLKKVAQQLEKASLQKIAQPKPVSRPSHDARMLAQLSQCKISPWNLALIRSVAKLKRNVELARQRDEAMQAAALSSSKRPQQETNLLQQRLSNLGLGELVMRGDGNCQFRSISHELFGSPEHHPMIRQNAVVYMLRNRESFQVFFSTVSEFESYTESMKRPGTWGDELTLKACAEAFQVTVHVLTSTGGFGGFYLEYSPNENEEARNHAFLTYLSPIHYNVMTIRDDVERKRLSMEAVKFLGMNLAQT